MLSLQARERGLTLTSRVTRHVNELCADRRAFKQILINLVGNAIKFTEAGGVVTIDADSDGENLTVSVSDTGIGIRRICWSASASPSCRPIAGWRATSKARASALRWSRGSWRCMAAASASKARRVRATVITVTLRSTGSALPGSPMPSLWTTDRFMPALSNFRRV